MADATLTKLTHLIADSPSLDLRHAALRVAGAIGPASDRGLTQTLLAKLDESEADIRIAAIDALGNLKIESALRRLEEFVRQGGPELEAAVHAASQLGAKGARAMGKIMDDAAPSVRSRIAAVLARSGSGNALVVSGHALLDDDPKVVDAAARSLAMEVPTYTPQQRHALAKFLHDSLHDKKQKLSAKTEAAMLRVLGTLHEAKAEDVFWARISPPHPHEVRAAALQALGNQGVPVNEARLTKLLACVAEDDFQIVAPALMLLKGVPATKKNAKHWLALLQAPDVATRRFAVEKLHGVESAEAARGLLVELAHPDKDLREAARQALLAFAAGRAAVLDKLLEAANADESWTLARSLAQVADQLPKSAWSKLFARAAKLHETDDRRAPALWFLLREVDKEGARDDVEKKADALRKKKNYPLALSYYRLLTQDSACAEDVRFELAATGLKLSSHDTSAEARNADPSLHQFNRLLQNASLDLIGKVAKARWLEPQDLFYLGFHFIEQTHRAREFGHQVLALLVKKSPTSALAKQARSKLRSEGFKK